MRSHLSRSTKRKLASKLTYNVFLRLLIFKFWFRMAFLAFVLLLVFLALFLPKIWTVSAPGTLPIIKISGLDLAQAWSLKRTARAEMAAGEFDRAHYAWVAAIGNNPTDRAAVRGLLHNVLAHPTTEAEALRTVISQSQWLLRLTQTNRADLELVAQLYDKYEQRELIIALLRPLADRLSPIEQAAFLKALFHLGALEEFGKRWKQFGADRLSDNELPLYGAAFAIASGSVTQAEQGRARLNAAFDDKSQRVLAHRLHLFACAQVNDLTRYEESLRRLEDLGEDRVFDHTTYWNLLRQGGRIAEAKERALAFTGQARAVHEFVALGSAYARLDANDRAQECFRAAVTRFPQSDEAWIAYTGFLAQIKSWDDLGRLAVQMRTEVRLQQRLSGYSYFLEGWSEWELNRKPRAEQAFRKLESVWTGHANLALSAASKLNEIGHPLEARQLLINFEDRLQDEPGYWRVLFASATALKDPALLLKAASGEFKLDPEKPEVANHYAAALLINRQQPELAAKLTLRLLGTYPNSVAARVNHGFSLLLNHRLQEARTLLSQVNTASLTPEQATPLFLALFQMHFQAAEYDQARQMAERINRELLFPTDLAWLEESEKKMPPRQDPKL